MKESFPAKILIFGEYTLLFGSPALALPYWRFSGKWVNGPQADQRLIDFFTWIKEKGPGHLLEISKMKRDFDAGLVFESTITAGYGVGSSGALVAAIWERYRLKNNYSNETLRTYLGEIESFFHGKSSGLDPLVSWLQTPVKLEANDSIVPLPELEDSPFFKKLFLLNSKRTRKTEPLVHTFREMLKQDKFKHIVKETLRPLTEQAIQALQNNDYPILEKTFQQISQIQLTYFQPMIPGPIAAIWEQGLRDGHFFMKLCGAGGGGYFLVLYPEKMCLKDSIGTYPLLPV